MIDRREEVLRRAAIAQALLENEVLIDAFTEVQDAYEAAWRDSKPSDSEGREEAYRMLAALRTVKARILTNIENGLFERRKAEAEAADRAINGIPG